MRWLPVSAIYRFPPPSKATAVGEFSAATDAGPPSPEDPCTPVPATVVMIPAALIRRTRWLSRSVKYVLPAPSESSPCGELKAALVAGPPSPENLYDPLPAMVLITPPATRRRRLLNVSAISKFPAASTAAARGLFSNALVAGPLSPAKTREPFAVPAMVVMTPAGLIRRMHWLKLSATTRLPAESRNTDAGKLNCAAVAWPPSPEKPAVPEPATVRMAAFDVTLRMR